MNKQKALDIIEDYKKSSIGDESKFIPIKIGEDTVGYLKPISEEYNLAKQEYVKLLSDWRSENQIGFASIFSITNARTENWIENILLKREDRILFMIFSSGDTPLGHIGLSSFDFQHNSCEIDNVVRGVKDNFTVKMADAMCTLIKWANELLDFQDVFLRVLAENTHAIDFYLRNGFIALHDIPLYKVERGNEILWTEEPIKGMQPDRYYKYMKYGK
jgi:hypothetical protein